jgi:hypothetical protein
MTKYTFEVFADYFQFYLADEGLEGDLSDAWTDEAVAQLLALVPGVIGVGTARNMDVPVEVQVLDQAPADHLVEWDQVNECTLEVPSGRIVVAGCTDYWPDAARVPVTPGTYRARVYYGDLNSVSENGLDGKDRYRIALWPAPAAPPLALISRAKAG